MRSGLSNLNSPHYYYGRSVTRFCAHLIASQLGFFRRRGLDEEAKEALRGIRGSKLGQTALVIGGGPSASKLNNAKIAEYVDEIFVINTYPLTSRSLEIIPDYICLSDPNSFVVSEGKKLEIQNLVWDYISKSKATVIAPFFYRNFNFPESSNKFFFDDREFFTFNRNISPLRPRSYNSMTFLKALAFAVFLGYSKIYIIGLDNTEFLGYEGDEANRLYLNYDKFFGEQSIQLLSNERINLDFFPNGLSGRLMSYSHVFGDLRLFEGKNIINLDPDSLIVNFKKEKWD